MDESDKIIYNKSILSGKVHETLEDPISQIYYDISDMISPELHNMGITPNMITYTRFLMIIIAFFYFFKKGNYKIVAVIFMIAYFGDCLDGHLARKYNMDTDFGDYIDHISDALATIISLYFIIHNLDKKNDWVIFTIAVMLTLNISHIACEERYLDVIGMSRKSDSLSVIQVFCPKKLIEDKDLEKFAEFIRFFGFGTYVLFISIILWNFDHLSQ